MQVLDYSAGFPGAAAIAEAGFSGAVRYIGFPNNPKCTTAAELEDFAEHDLGMALVYEHTAGDWRAGYDGGVASARRAREHADAIGFPSDRPIYFAVDQDVVHEHEFQAAMEYLRGAAEELGGVEFVGVYGEHDIVSRAAAEEVASYFWQCRAWSGTPVRLFEARHLYQHAEQRVVGGVQCDINDVLIEEDWGQHDAEREEPNPDHERIREAIDLLQQILDGSDDSDESDEDSDDEEAAALMTHGEARVVDALRDLATGSGDVGVLAKALAPLLPRGVTADSFAQALSAELAA
ncbi:hypothetical protein Lesp02_56790 [Lentzea sp. NBRC 105346]|uniref:DUF1906 domain-containing protein n=1 Tax=Lentzea sp. NBRC 105346 TaxID=3032205 RepID=UPI0024A41AE8|nr:DUF1906 domain-containing protein [Lentzea sp. NBRC 105346]GLZ33491.1 hypothetical protein Lesp02_56790 [Lentzea sp. NBRC 105346]